MCDCDDMIFAPRSGSSPSQQPAVVILFDGEALQPAPAAAAAEERGKVCQEIVPSFLSAWAEHSSSSTPGLFAVSPAQPAQHSPAQPSPAGAAWRSLTKTDSGQKSQDGELQGYRATDLQTYTEPGHRTLDTNIGHIIFNFLSPGPSSKPSQCWDTA